MTTTTPALKPCECCGEQVPDDQACDEWGQLWDDRPAPAGDHRYCHACFVDACDCDQRAPRQ